MFLRLSALCVLAASTSGVAAEKNIPFLPPGIAGAIQGARLSHEDLTLALHPPQEDEKNVNDALDSLLKIEQLAGKAAESDYIAQKQRLLNAEISKIHDIVSGSAKGSFLSVAARPFDSAGIFGDILADSDYEIRMHPPEQTAAEVTSALQSLLKVENSKLASATADFVADKKRLLNAEVSKIRSLVAGA